MRKGVYMEKSVIMKVHKYGHSTIMALCDGELLGKVFKKGDINFKITEDFYGGDTVDPETILRTIPLVESINAVGDRCIGLLKEAGLLDDGEIVDIGGTPHVQIYSIG